MRTVPTFTFSILTLASLEAAAALSATVPPAWLKAEVSLPEHSRSPLVVKLSPDMTPCRAKYGNEAASKCSRLFGLVSSRVTGVSLSPAVEGVWRWEARGALAFTPEEPWPERTTFKVDLSGLRLPSATTLNTPVIDFTTPPLTMTSGFATFWMDPAVSGERALTVDALFSTTIADTKAFEASVKVDVPSRSGLTFGKPIFIWNHFRTGFYMKLPVRTLGNATNVRITFPKAAGKWTAADGRHPVVQPGFRQAFVSYTIPAADSLYKMGEASLSPTRTETLEQVYELVLRPSLLTKPSDIVAAMRVTALPARMNEEAVSPTDWRRAPAVTPDVLARGTPVPVSIAHRPLRRLRTYLPRTLGARRLPRLVVDEQLLQRLFHGREDRHGSRPSGRTPIPRSVQRFVGVVSQQDRIVDRIPYFQSTQEKIVRQQLVLPPRSPTDSNHPPHEHRFRIVIFQPYP